MTKVQIFANPQHQPWKWQPWSFTPRQQKLKTCRLSTNTSKKLETNSPLLSSHMVPLIMSVPLHLIIFLSHQNMKKWMKKRTRDSPATKQPNTGWCRTRFQKCDVSSPLGVQETRIGSCPRYLAVSLRQSHCNSQTWRFPRCFLVFRWQCIYKTKGQCQGKSSIYWHMEKR